MKAELLAPAGSWESLRAALLAGADAVYLGGSLFGARAYAENLDTEQLKEAIDLCHLQDKRLYLTVNTLLKERELTGKLYDYLAPLYETGLDAVIVQDPGVFHFIRREFPELPIHASTQMTVHSACGAKLLWEAGASRIVTSRELSLKEIEQIRRECDAEIESFVHGALCYCYSGQCLLSSMIGGRSGNRGRCAQPCRLPYSAGNEKNVWAKEKYLLSPKDICTLEILPEILKAGVYSLKIEGRMKKPAYTAKVTQIYRKYLDLLEEKGSKNWSVDPGDLQDLMDLYNRGGFSEGYYRERNGKAMMSVNIPSHYGTKAAVILENRKGNLTLAAKEDLHRQDVLENYTLAGDVKKGETFQLRTRERFPAGQVLRRTKNAALAAQIADFLSQKDRQKKINGKLMISRGESAILILTDGELTVQASGCVVQEAKTQGLTEERVRRQLEKTGNSPFVFENLTVEMESGCFLPLQSLNELRRDGLLKLEEEILKQFRRKLPPKTAALPHEKTADAGWMPVFFASVQTQEQLTALLKIPEIRRIYIDGDAIGEAYGREGASLLQKLCRDAGKECWLALPRIFRLDLQQRWDREDSKKVLLSYDGLLIRNLEEVQFLREHGCAGKMVCDHSLYLFNRETRNFYGEQGLCAFTASVELNHRELEEVGCEDAELIVYGRLPLMVTAQCVKKTTGQCTKQQETFWLRDRKNASFPVKNHCYTCQNTIYNSAPVRLMDQQSEIEAVKPAALRFSFVTEDERETGDIAEAFVQVFLKGKEPSELSDNFTRGHFKRGIE